MPEMITRATSSGNCLTWACSPAGCWWSTPPFSKVRPVEGGPECWIAVLREALGPAGTLVMPGMTEDDDHPLTPRQTPCPGLGVVADTFWRMPGCCAPTARFPAAGAQAARSRPPPFDAPHGLNSPIGRVYELDGQVCCCWGSITRQYHHPPGRVPIWRALPAQEVRHSAPERPADAL